MRVLFLSDKDKWNDFVLANQGSFLQSFEWGQIQESQGRKVWRLWLIDEKIDENQPIFCAQIVGHNLPFSKNYLYAPHGPIFRRGIIDKISEIGNFLDKKREYFSKFLNTAEDLCQKENAVFLRMEPLLKSEMHLNYLLEAALKKSDKEIQPSRTIILDLEKSEEELLSEMKSKTRYNIGLAERHGVKIIRCGGLDKEKHFEKFWELLEETSKRDKFYLHSKKNYDKILNMKSECFRNELYLAVLGGEVLAGAMINFFNNKAVYLHGASLSKRRDIMAPYLLHWEIIKDAKNNSFKQYDFWGISEKWPGVTRFKQGFGGKEIKYLGAFDLIVDKKWYFLYSLARKIL